MIIYDKNFKPWTTPEFKKDTQELINIVKNDYLSEQSLACINIALGNNIGRTYGDTEEEFEEHWQPEYKNIRHMFLSSITTAIYMIAPKNIADQIAEFSWVEELASILLKHFVLAKGYNDRNVIELEIK